MADQFDTLQAAREPSVTQGIALALQGFGAGVGGQLPQFQQSLQNRAERRTALTLERKQAFAQDLLGTKNLIDAGDLQGGASLLSGRIEMINQLGGDPSETMELLQAINSAQTPEELQAISGELGQLVNRSVQAGFLEAPKGAGGLASAKTEILPDGSVVQALPDGSVQVRNPQGQIVTGEARTATLRQSQQAGLDITRQEADIAVSKAERTAVATQRASRTSDMTRDFTTRNQEAKRGAINLAQAATLVEKATQGAAGAFEVQLARVFPGIDVADEAALSQSLTNLALDELQKFKGPTTDFEFQKTEQIAGTLGDSKTANRAKIASLQRANWFAQREAKQFQDHIKARKNPDTFGFNFNEQIKTKRGDFSLQDLQDTAVDNNITIEETIKRLNK